METDFLPKMIIKRVLGASTMYSESGGVFRWTDRPNWAMVFKYEGETVYTVGTRQVVSDKRGMVMLPKGLSYEARFTKSGHYCIIEFETDAACESILQFPLRNADEILGLFKKAEYQRNLGRPMAEIEGIRCAYAVILKLAEEAARVYTPSDSRRRLFPALDYMAKNYTRKLRTDELAALAGLSPDYFRKLFSRTYGVSPVAYIHALRIRKAKEMLMSDYLTITDIAISLGYENIYDFSRCFKKAVGVAPSAYLKMSTVRGTGDGKDGSS